MPSVNRIFPLRVLTAGAISLFLNITGAIAPVAHVLNTPLDCCVAIGLNMIDFLADNTFIKILL